MKNFVICANGIGVGGMEVLFSGYIKYLVSKNYNVYLITINTPNNIYFKLLEDIDNIKYIFRSQDNILYMSSKNRTIERNNVRMQLQGLDYQNTFGVCGYFRDLLILMNIFHNTETKITLIWPHPLDWTNYISFKHKQYYFKREKNSSLYKYQKLLLAKLDQNNASYYTSYAIFDYNNWYYETALPERKIEGLPIQKNAGVSFNYYRDEWKKEWSILWVGRFDYYKNDAICKIFETLEIIAAQKNIKFTFNIAGYGPDSFVADLHNRIKPTNVKVNYLGAIPPTELNTYFSQNDIGIGMGVTVKQMGFAGLPSILIDSLSERYEGENNCTWVFDIDTGDDGDGLYYQVMKKPLKNRKPLLELLCEVVDHPSLLNEYSKKCKEYIEKNYSYDKQYDIITKRVLSSTFDSSKIEIYHYGFLRTNLRKIKRLFSF